MLGDVFQYRGAVESVGKIIALAEFATDPGQELGIGFVFYAFGHHRALEFMRHGDNAGQNHFAVSIDVGAAMPGQEALVDLDRIDRQGAELAQGASAGGEIVG